MVVLPSTWNVVMIINRVELNFTPNSTHTQANELIWVELMKLEADSLIVVPFKLWKVNELQITTFNLHFKNWKSKNHKVTPWVKSWADRSSSIKSHSFLNFYSQRIRGPKLDSYSDQSAGVVDSKLDQSWDSLDQSFGKPSLGKNFMSMGARWTQSWRPGLDTTWEQKLPQNWFKLGAGLGQSWWC